MLVLPGITFLGGPEAAAGFAYVGSRIVADTGTCPLTGLTGGVDTEAREGDFVLVMSIRASVSNSVFSVPAGYTIVTDAYYGDVFDTNVGVAYKFMGAVPDASVTIGWTSGTGVVTGVQVWRGVDTVTPQDVAHVSAGGGNALIPNPAAITPVTNGAQIIVIGGCATSAIPALSIPYATDNRNAADSGSQFAALSFGYVDWVGGVYDPAAFTWGGGGSASLSSWGAVTMALRPAT